MGNIKSKPKYLYYKNNLQYEDITIYISSLSDNIIDLDLNNLHLTSLPDLSRFTNLTRFSCILNEITELPKLPPSINRLILRCNELTNIDQITELTNLIELDCSNNCLYSLPTLPPKLIKLDCSENNISSLPELPRGLKELICSNNTFNIVKLDILPKLSHLYNLECIICNNTNISSFPEFQLENIEYIDCEDTPFMNELRQIMLLSEGINVDELTMEEKINSIYKISTI